MLLIKKEVEGKREMKNSLTYIKAKTKHILSGISSFTRHDVQ